MTWQWVEQRKLQWGEDSSTFQNRVLGEFSDNSEEGIIPLSWVRAAQERYRKMTTLAQLGELSVVTVPRVLGVDVARLGTDSTVVYERHGLFPQHIHVFSKSPTTVTAGKLVGMLRGHSISIEMDGYGASVYDMLKEQRVASLYGYVPAGRTLRRDKTGTYGFRNVRSAAWWNLRELLDPNNPEAIGLPDHPGLVADLVTPAWKISSTGTIELEPKEHVKRRLGRSPDYGDACAIAWWPTNIGGGVVF